MYHIVIVFVIDFVIVVVTTATARNLLQPGDARTGDGYSRFT
jgi:hypothetical protein